MFDVVGLWEVLKSMTCGYEGETPINGWTWVKDPVLQHYYDQDQTRLSDEINSIQKNGGRIRARNIIRAHCQGLICKLKMEDRDLLERTHLPCDVLSSMVRSYITEAGEDWRVYLVDRYNIEDFRCDWYGSEYSKGIVGHLISLAGCAANDSSVNGFTERQLCDILWAIRISLKNMVEIELAKALSRKDLILLTELVMNTSSKYLDLHLETARNFKSVGDNYGKLPKRWEKEVRQEEKRLVQLKADGLIDGRYNDEISDFSYTIDMAARSATVDGFLQSRLNGNFLRKEPIVVDQKVEIVNFDQAKERMERLFADRFA